MDQLPNISNNENGYVLVVALLVMVILSLLGIAGLNTSMFEEQIAGNDWNAKRTFYRADGGISLGSELIEQNFNCPAGFGSADIEGTVQSNNLSIYTNAMLDAGIKPGDSNYDTARVIGRPADADAIFPWDGNAPAPTLDVGYLYYGGQTVVLPGGALQMAAGYEGKGKSAGQGGVAKEVDIYSQFLGPRNSESILLSGWRHLVGTEGSCIY